MIYVVRAVGLGRVKIGYSENPQRRLAALQTACPAKLELVRVFAGEKRDEAALHDRFAKHRVQGEWFAETPVILALGQGADAQVEPGEWGRVAIVEGEHAGKVGCYDDTEWVPDERCECLDECEHDQSGDDLAIVYLDPPATGYVVVPHDWLARVAEAAAS